MIIQNPARRSKHNRLRLRPLQSHPEKDHPRIPMRPRIQRGLYYHLVNRKSQLWWGRPRIITPIIIKHHPSFTRLVQNPKTAILKLFNFQASPLSPSPTIKRRPLVPVGLNMIPSDRSIWSIPTRIYLRVDPRRHLKTGPPIVPVHHRPFPA